MCGALTGFDCIWLNLHDRTMNNKVIYEMLYTYADFVCAMGGGDGQKRTAVVMWQPKLYF